ncbi:hypothetical protein N9Y31_03390 [Alphaproteobacteria bacterium]|nr:hypothetical protein [Alphaproteobacteria bacterium]
MAIIPLRDLGGAGVITDVAPYNLPTTGFDKAFNVRFDEGRVSRAPVFRKIKDSLGFTPRFVYGIVPASGFDTVLMLSDDWQLQEYANNNVTNVSGAITGSSDPRPFTGTSLADVTYINRQDRVPVQRKPSASTFSDLPNWDSTWRCAALRSYGDQLVALNMTEGSNEFPTRVRFSDITSANDYPGSWDATDPTTSAGFNDLVQIPTEIRDGLTLGSNFIIYSSDQTWLMEFTGGTFIFNFRKLFSDAGVINQNCVVEAEGKHYVFGAFDIYMHDGTSKQSICDERVKKFIYQSLNNENADICFAQHNQALNEIYFCYMSGDSHVEFPNATRCNRAAVYNYRANTWSFMDLPNVSAGTTANVNSVATYASSTTTYNLTGGTYYSQQDGYDRHTLMVGEDLTADGLTSDKLYGLDLSDTGTLSFDLDTEATKYPYLERTGFDLDESGLAARQYVVVTRMYPQADTINSTDTTMTFEFGASDIPRNTPSYSAPVTFDLSTQHKIDSRAAGRYLSYRMTLTDNKDFDLSGFDIELTPTGAR